MGELRNGLIARAADAVIAVGGEFGTLAEIGFALKLGRPVVGLGTWELRRQGRTVEAIVPAADPAGAVERALALSAARSG
jgi:predicted Rossmann-fold nucleotide-binding protein